MIVIEISAKKPKPAPFVYSGGSYKPPAVTHIPPPSQSSDIQKEVERRCQVVKDLVTNLPYKEGDICEARGEDKEKYGDIRILNIARSYAELGAAYEWRSDNPMLVYATSLKDSSKFFCTVNFLEKKQ